MSYKESKSRYCMHSPLDLYCACQPRRRCHRGVQYTSSCKSSSQHHCTRSSPHSTHWVHATGCPGPLRYMRKALANAYVSPTLKLSLEGYLCTSTVTFLHAGHTAFDQGPGSTPEGIQGAIKTPQPQRGGAKLYRHCSPARHA